MEKLHIYLFPPETSNSKWSLRNIFLFCPPLPPRGHLPQPGMGFCRPNESHTWLKSSGNGRSPVHTCQEGKYGKNWSSVLTTKVTKVPAHFFFPFFPPLRASTPTGSLLLQLIHLEFRNLPLLVLLLTHNSPSSIPSSCRSLPALPSLISPGLKGLSKEPQPDNELRCAYGSVRRTRNPIHALRCYRACPSKIVMLTQMVGAKSAPALSPLTAKTSREHTGHESQPS